MAWAGPYVRVKKAEQKQAGTSVLILSALNWLSNCELLPAFSLSNGLEPGIISRIKPLPPPSLDTVKD